MGEGKREGGNERDEKRGEEGREEKGRKEKGG